MLDESLQVVLQLDPEPLLTCSSVISRAIIATYFCMVVQDSGSAFNILILCGIYSIAVLSELHSGHGKEQHGLTPPTSASSCYTSRSSVLPYTPLQLSRSYGHMNVGSDNFH